MQIRGGGWSSFIRCTPAFSLTHRKEQLTFPLRFWTPIDSATVAAQEGIIQVKAILFLYVFGACGSAFSTGWFAGDAASKQAR